MAQAILPSTFLSGKTTFFKLIVDEAKSTVPILGQMVEPLLHDIGVHVLTDINVTLHDHLAGETWLEQHSRAPETYGANSGDVSFKELVNLFSSTARRFASQRLWNKTSTHGTQGIMLFRLGARKSWAGTNFPLHGDTNV